jgi:hypothetical protein
MEKEPLYFDMCNAKCEECQGINIEYIKDNKYRCLNTGKILKGYSDNFEFGRLEEES